MNYEQIVKWYKEEQTKGYTKEQLILSLKQQNYSEKDILWITNLSELRYYPTKGQLFFSMLLRLFNFLFIILFLFLLFLSFKIRVFIQEFIVLIYFILIGGIIIFLLSSIFNTKITLLLFKIGDKIKK